MKQHSSRVTNLLKKYAHIIGGTDENGIKHEPKPENVQKQHLFFVSNRDEDEMSGEFMLGHVIKGKIIDDMYDIGYCGLNIHSREPKKGEEISKEHKDTLARVRRYKERQLKQIAEGVRLDNERRGIFEEVPVEPEVETPSED